MDNRIYQMQMNFIPMEDRILFRMSTSKKEEFSVWLTRRYVKLLWPVLQDMLLRVSPSSISPTTNPLAREAIQSFEHQRAIANTNFAEQYEEPDDMRRPLGNTPILVSRIRVRSSDDIAQTLAMHPEEGQGIEIMMNENMLHSFIGLLTKTLTVTDWDLSYVLASAMPAFAQYPGTGEKAALH